MRKLRTRPPRFVSVDNRAVDDLRLSVLDVGLLTVALRCPDGYDFTVADLARKRRPGREALTKAMRTLVACGYVVKLKIQDAASGTWRTEFSVADMPFSQEDVAGMLQDVSGARAVRVEPVGSTRAPGPPSRSRTRSCPVAAGIRVPVTRLRPAQILKIPRWNRPTANRLPGSRPPVSRRLKREHWKYKTGKANKTLSLLPHLPQPPTGKLRAAARAAYSPGTARQRLRSGCLRPLSQTCMRPASGSPMPGPPHASSEGSPYRCWDASGWPTARRSCSLPA